MKALSGAAWLVIGRVVGDALAFGLFILVAREFGPAGTGIYFFNFAIATIFYELVSLGIEEYGVREYARRPSGTRTALLGDLFGAQLLLGLATGAAVLLAGTALGEVHLPLLAFMVVYQLAFAVSRTLFIPAFVGGRVAIQVLSETLIRAAVLAVAIFIVTASAGAASLVLTLAGLPPLGIALVLIAFASARHFAGRIGLAISLRGLRPALAAIWPFAAANVVSGVYTRSAILVLFVMAGGVEAGLFASAYKFAEVSWALLTLVPWAGYPYLARLIHESAHDFRILSGSLLRVTLLCGGVFAWATYWIVPPLMDVLLGPEFRSAVPIVHALAAFVALLAINEYLERILLVAELQIPRLKILAVQLASNLILNLLLVPRFGIAGAVAAFIVSQAIVVPVFLGVLRSRIALGDLVRSIAIYSLALAGAMLSAELPMQDSPHWWVAPLLSLFTFCLISRAGGLLRLTRAPGALRSHQAWGR